MSNITDELRAAAMSLRRKSMPLAELVPLLSAAALLLDKVHAEQERAYQQLEIAGVSRERARSIDNGIGVLVQRFNKYQTAAEANLARIREIMEANDPGNARELFGPAQEHEDHPP